MKLLILLVFAAIVFYSCSKEEPAKLETFSTEAFAYDLGNSWEVNATTRVKGFSQAEEDDNFSATIAYEIDLVKPSGDTIKALISKVEDKTEKEKIMDIPIEAQFELDSTYAEGEYKILFRLRDPATEQTAVSSVSLQIENE
jgi:hypothetical protein